MEFKSSVQPYLKSFDELLKEVRFFLCYLIIAIEVNHAIVGSMGKFIQYNGGQVAPSVIWKRVVILSDLNFQTSLYYCTSL